MLARTDSILPVFIPIALIVLYLILDYVMRLRPRLGPRKFSTWRDLAESLARVAKLELVDDPMEWHEPSKQKLVGEIEGRHVEIRWVWVHAGKRASTTHTLVEVACDAAFTARITEETLETKAAKAFGLGDDVRIGRAVFDDRFYIEGDDPKKLRTAMRSGLADAIQRAFSRFGVIEVTIKGGRLTARIPPYNAQKLSAEAHKNLLILLAEAAASFDRVTIKVANLGERKALRGRASVGRCGYCHVDLTGQERDLVACSTCSTVLHEGCWDELDRCPVLGCAGDRRDRGARARTS